MSVTETIFIQTFIDVLAARGSHAVSTEPLFASADPRSDGVLTGGIVVAPAVFQRAFVDIVTALFAETVAAETRTTDAEMRAFGVATEGVFVAPAGPDVALVDVRAAVKTYAAAFVARDAFALAGTDSIGAISFV